MSDDGPIFDELDDYTASEAILQSAQHGTLPKVRNDLAWLTTAYTHLGTEIADGEDSADTQALFDRVEELLDVLRLMEGVLREAESADTAPSDADFEKARIATSSTPIDGEYIQTLGGSGDHKTEQPADDGPDQTTQQADERATTDGEPPRSDSNSPVEGDTGGGSSEQTPILGEPKLRQEVERLVDILDRIPSRGDAVERGNYDIDAFERYGDSWKAVLSRAGFDVEEEMLEHLRAIHDQTNDVVTPAHLVETTYEYGRYVDVFGDWTTTLDMADLDVHRGRLLAAIQQCYFEVDRVPSESHLTDHTPFPPDEYISEFGSVVEAISTAEIDYESALLDALAKTAEQVGHPPTTATFSDHSMYHSNEVYEFFDDWDDALAAAELPEAVTSETENPEEPETSTEPATDESSTTQTNGKEESITGPDTPPQSPLSEWCDAIRGLQTLQHSIYGTERDDLPPDDPGLQWMDDINKVATTHGLDNWKEGYGEQHRQRADYDIAEYRDAYGDGDRVTEFYVIETVSVSESAGILAGSAETNHLSIPVAPESEHPLPIIVTSEAELSRAQTLLSELPARPAVTTNVSGDGHLESLEKPESSQQTDSEALEGGTAAGEEESSAGVDLESQPVLSGEASTNQAGSDEPDDSLRSDRVIDELTTVNGIDRETAQILIQAGYNGVDALADATTDDLTELEGIDHGRAFRIDFALED